MQVDVDVDVDSAEYTYHLFLYTLYNFKDSYLECITCRLQSLFLQGNTIFVKGYGLTEKILQESFTKFGELTGHLQRTCPVALVIKTLHKSDWEFIG